MSTAEVLDEAPSPFLPGTSIQFAWDSTSLGWLKTCPRLYQYQMLEGWTGRGESIHLRFGQEYHRALENYDRGRAVGMAHEVALREVVKELLIDTRDWNFDYPSLPKSAQLKTRDNLLRTVIWYLDQFKNDAAETYLLLDGRPAVELSFRFELDFGPPDGQPYLLCGHLDKVVRYQDELFVMDRKTTTTTPGDYYFNQFHPNNQMTLYTFGSQVIFETPVKGVIIDAAQIAAGFSRFIRGITYRTPDQLDEWLDDLEWILSQAEVYAEKNYWPQNDTACDKFGGCRFREVCSKSPQVRERFLEANFERGERWNPLKPR